MSTYAREQDLLYWMMTQKSVPEGVEKLKPEWFSDRMHGQIFDACMKLLNSQGIAIPPDIADMIDKADPVDPGRAEERREYIWDLTRHGLSPNPSYTIKIITEHGKRIEMKKLFIAAVHAMDEHDSYDLALAHALGHIDSMAMRDADKGILTAHQLNVIGCEWMQRMQESGGELPGLSTGFGDLDELIFGLKPCELITIAGASGMGKTTFATNVAENVALSHNVLVVSREMGETQIALRHYASQGGVSLRSLQKGVMDQDEWVSFEAGIAKLDRLKLFYDLDSSTPSQIALRARQIKRKHGSLGLIMVDHIGLMRSDSKRRSRYEEIADITWALKGIAKDMNVPVIEVAQISRDVKNRADKRPLLTDMADSSSIEKDSDVVIGIYRDDYYDTDSAFKGMAEALVLKNRMGECKPVPLVWMGSMNKFKSCDMQTWHQAKQKQQDSKPQKKSGGFNVHAD